MKATVPIVLCCLVLACVSVTLAQDPVVRVTPEQLKWVPEPDGLGFQTAVVEGDPAKPSSNMKCPNKALHLTGNRPLFDHLPVR